MEPLLARSSFPFLFHFILLCQSQFGQRQRKLCTGAVGRPTVVCFLSLEAKMQKRFVCLKKLFSHASITLLNYVILNEELKELE